jgi:hypothetical protein
MTSSSNNNAHQLLSMNNGDDTTGTTLNSFDPDDIPRPTANGGYSHTKASRAKIAAANKGKTPWNKGKQRSEGTKARIAAGVRARNRERFLLKLQDMGVTEEAYEETKKAARREKDRERRSRRTSKGGYRPTEETKAKISRILKEKHANGEIKPRKIDLSKVRRGFKHSDETKAKISEALRQRWANDPVYRQNMQNQVVRAHNSEEVRQRISTTLKKKWEDPEFRSQMMEKISTRKTSVTGGYDSSHREKISQAMKAKWQESEYREKSLKSIAKRKDETQRDRPATPARPRVPRPKKITQVKGSAAAQRSDDVVMVLPMSQGDNKQQKKKKKKAPRKKNVRFMDKDEDDSGPVATVATVATVEPKTKGARKKVAAKKKEAKKKEPDGSVNRLKEERRDLFDLLYGDDNGDDDDDDDEDVDDEGDDDPHSRGPARFALGDEDLDSFDPYGLDDY